MEHAPTWFNTLANHRGLGGCFGCMYDMTVMAHNLGYSYMCWNDRIYHIEFMSTTAITAFPKAVYTGLTFKDMK